MATTLKSDRIWEKFLEQFQKSDPKKRTLVAIFQFNLQQNGKIVKTITVDLKSLKIHEGQTDTPDATITVEDDLLIAIARQEKSLIDCVRENLLEMSGSVQLVEQLSARFKR